MQGQKMKDVFVFWAVDKFWVLVTLTFDIQINQRCETFVLF